MLRLNEKAVRYWKGAVGVGDPTSTSTMADDNNRIPVDGVENNNGNDEPQNEATTSQNPPTSDEGMGDRLERLGGEPAPVITPEEFARLQKAGQVHIDSRGRVRTASRSGPDAGVSLRKRRAWYGR